MTQDVQGTLAGLESNTPPKEALKFFEEAREVVGRRKLRGMRIDEGMIPLVLGLLPLVTSVPIATTPIPYLCASSLVLQL